MAYVRTGSVFLSNARTGIIAANRNLASDMRQGSYGSGDLYILAPTFIDLSVVA
jgi:hypothetical protein